MAVIEGVMIKGKKYAVVAVRDTEGELKVTRRDVAGSSRPFMKWPVMRGLLVFWQTLALGLWALDFSAKEAAGEEDTPPWLMGLTMTVAFLLGIALFFYLPLLLTQLARDYLAASLHSALAFNLVDGLIRIAIFVLYVMLISLIPGIKRVFQYHGAEHKAVAAFEKEGLVDPQRARKYSTLHARCGTAFLLTVMVVSILFFSFIPSEASFAAKLAWRLVLLPVIAGSSFEIIRLAEKPGGRWLSWFLAPGLWLQKLTTREPDDDQLAVASSAVEEIVNLECKSDA
jgi:uncharacterized protein YqhQ